MRTTSMCITKTCPACNSLNRIVIMTSGLPPRWRIGCSRCGESIAGPRAAPRSAEIVPLPVPAMRRGRELRPAAASIPGLPAASRTSRALARHPALAVRTVARASTGISLLAACGVVIAALILDAAPRPDAEPPAGRIELAADETARPAAAGTVDRRPAAHPVPPAVAAVAAAAVGDPGVASIIDLRRPLPELYPDPREGMMALDLAARSVGNVAEAEAGLQLTAGTRRELQRRLRLAEHDPKGIDGIFGPATRSAISEWQEASGLPATGYLDEPAMALLVEQTDAEYRAWRTADRERREREQRMATVDTVRRPMPAAADGCVRQFSGEIAYGVSVRCDFKGLRENFSALRGNLAGLL